MADYGTATRIIAISSLLVGLDYPVETWEAAYEKVKNMPQPDTLTDVAEIVTVLTEARPGIVGALLAEQEAGEVLIVPEADLIELAKTAPKTTTRGAKNDG